jgi:hypothetical protein
MNRASVISLTFALLVLILGGCGGPPQIGADKDTFKTVDALYTAVSLRDPKLVGQCAAKLQRLRDASKIPAGAYSSLESIIAAANDGKWESAQERLSTFMEGQRRSSRGDAAD